MSEKQRLSYSAINTYATCGEKFKLSYKLGYREKTVRSSLVFGGAIDQALNELLVSRDLTKAKETFSKAWYFQNVNRVYTSLKGNADIQFSVKDLDTDLLEVSQEDKEWLNSFQEYKEGMKWNDIPEPDRIKYNTICWESLAAKADIILESYNKKILPQFSIVKGVQEKVELTSTEGDTLVQYLDFCALYQGQMVLFDNKTTSSLDYYSDNSPGISQQLISYYFSSKEKYQLSAVGYIAISKQIIKNKIKICTVCQNDGSSSRAKTCDQEIVQIVEKKGKLVEVGVRCNGEWKVTIDPEAAIKIIVNEVTDKAQELVMSSIEDATHAIKQGIYYKNLSVCGNQFGSKCPFFDLCWKNDASNLCKKDENS